MMFTRWLCVDARGVERWRVGVMNADRAAASCFGNGTRLHCIHHRRRTAQASSSASFSRLQDCPLHRTYQQWRGKALQHRSYDCTAKNHHSLNMAEQRELQARMERKQMKEFMTVSASDSSVYYLSIYMNSDCLAIDVL